jgi:5S rRNA maturation endonuclease (ribonuclease M5)
MPSTREPDPDNAGGGIVKNISSPLRKEGCFIESRNIRQRYS